MPLERDSGHKVPALSESSWVIFVELDFFLIQVRCLCFCNLFKTWPKTLCFKNLTSNPISQRVDAMINTLKFGKWLDTTILGEVCLPPAYNSKNNSQHRHQKHAVSGTAFTLRYPDFANGGWWFPAVNVSSLLTSPGCEVHAEGCASHRVPSGHAALLQVEAYFISDLKCLWEIRKRAET